jgi:hypothetical protein
VSDAYQILVIDVPEADARACEARILAYLRERDIIGDTMHQESEESVAILMKYHARWLRRGGLRGAELKTRLAEARDHQLARRWWSTSEGAREIVEAHGDQLNIGSWQDNYSVEVVRGRQVHMDLNEPTVARCPACGDTTRDLRWWQEPLARVGSEYEATGAAALACASCHMASPLDRWSFDPAAALGTLALRFGNFYELRETFVGELAAVAGHRVSRTFQRV